MGASGRCGHLYLYPGLHQYDDRALGSFSRACGHFSCLVSADRICRTFQINSLFENLSVFENLRIARQAKVGGSFRILSLKQKLKPVIKDTWAMLERLGLEKMADMSPSETHHIADLIRDLANDLSVVLVEHDMDMVMRISDRITALQDGYIITESTPKEIRNNQQVKKAYFGKAA